MLKPMDRNNAALLTPKEWLHYYEYLNKDYQAICLALLHTGMRVEEMRELMRNRDWYKPSNRAIFLPKSAIKKVKTRHKERHIILTEDGCHAIEALFVRDPTIPSRQAMTCTLKRAAVTANIDPTNIVPKMFRKMIISWLVSTGDYSELVIAASAGHTLETMKDHYLGLAFKKSDVEDMRKFLKGWGEA